MATRSKPNWKVLDRLRPLLEQEGWSHAQIAEDWGMSLATLEGHLTQEEEMENTEAIWQQRLTKRLEGIPWKVIIEAEGLKYGGTFTGQLKKARELGWIPPEDTLPPAIRSDGKRVGIPVSSADQVHRPVQTSPPVLDTSVDESAESSAENSVDDHVNHIPVHTAVQKIDTGPVQILDTGAVQRLDRLEEEVQTLAQAMRSIADRLNHVPVQTPMQITALPSYPKGKSVRWNLWILDSIRDEIATLAAERDVSPSQLVQEILWKALSDRVKDTQPR